jgi:ribose 5-phosphate isomerase B
MPQPGNSEVIAIASDHAGFELKSTLKEHLQTAGLSVLDLGIDSSEQVDYPDMADALARAVLDGRAPRGVVICGTGIGVSIAANRHRGIRAALCHDVTTARLARRHNDANVLALGGRILGPEVARECLDAFLATAYEGGRHDARVRKL